MTEPTIIITLKEFPRELWARVSAQATREGTEKRQIVIKAVAEYLANRKEAKA